MSKPAPSPLSVAAAGRPGRAVPMARDRVVEVAAARLNRVAPGTPVRITGTAQPLEDLLTSPVERRECIAYRLVVERPGWHLVVDQSACAAFALVAGDTTVNVRGPFSVLLQADHCWDFGDDVQARLDALAEAGRAAPGRRLARAWRAVARGRRRAGTPSFRYFEALLRPGMRVVVEGTAGAEEIDPRGDRDTFRAPPLRRTVIASPEHPVVVSEPWPGALCW